MDIDNNTIIEYLCKGQSSFPSVTQTDEQAPVCAECNAAMCYEQNGPGTSLAELPPRYCL